MHHRVLALFCLLLAALSARGWAADARPAGVVFRVQGQATALQGARRRELTRGSRVFVGEVLTTGPRSRLGLRLADDSLLRLGADTRFTVTRFEFPEAGDEGSVLMELSRGVFRAVTGKVMQRPDGRFEVRTGLGTLGVRGTDFWGELRDGELHALMLEGRGVYVVNAAGRVELSEPGAGTTVRRAEIATRGTRPAPQAAKPWSAERIARARASVDWLD